MTSARGRPPHWPAAPQPLLTPLPSPNVPVTARPRSVVRRCVGCKAAIATVTVPEISVVSFYDDETGANSSRRVPIGAKVVLEPGYVNARRRHASGARWYWPGRRASSPSPKVRLPAVVTCRCGLDVELWVNEDASAFAQGDGNERAAKLDSILEAEGEDQAVDAAVDAWKELRAGAREIE